MIRSNIKHKYKGMQNYYASQSQSVIDCNVILVSIILKNYDNINVQLFFLIIVLAESFLK